MRNHTLLIASLVCFAFFGCTVISKQTTDQAQPLPEFDQLIQQTDRYVGETVVLGGYVLSVDNLESHTRIIALEAPLGSGQRPKSKDLSRGRLILRYDGFIDPEVYTKERQITIGGQILEPITDDPPSFPYLHVQISEIHLWPEQKPVPEDPYWDDPFCYYPWRPYPYPWRYPYWPYRYWCD